MYDDLQSIIKHQRESKEIQSVTSLYIFILFLLVWRFWWNPNFLVIFYFIFYLEMNDYIKNYLIDVKNLCNQSNLIQKLRKKNARHREGLQVQKLSKSCISHHIFFFIRTRSSGTEHVKKSLFQFKSTIIANTTTKQN